MSYNPLTWGHIATDLSESRRTLPVDLGVTRRGQVASFPISKPAFDPLSTAVEAASAVASVAQLAAFNPYVAGIGATLFGAKFIYDGVKELF